MLTHQARRLNSPALFVTQNDARFFPNVKQLPERKNFLFDRILCDVPCSGDGTLRKNLSMWPNFHMHMGHSNHKLQLDILLRGLDMLKVGGRLVYSTCSFNPIENEAVVLAALTKLQGQVSIVDVSKEVSSHLKYRPGMLAWKVFHRGKGNKDPAMWFTDWRSVPPEKSTSAKDAARLVETMFSDTYTRHNNLPDVELEDPYNLRRCLRLLPHDDNQGGFFCAVLTKTAPIVSTKAAEAWTDSNVR